MNDFDTGLNSVPPHSSVLHYRDPVVYNKKLKIIGELETKKLAQILSKFICLALKIDGSADRQNKDNKFVVVQYDL
jgi:hypothetical protein